MYYLYNRLYSYLINSKALTFVIQIVPGTYGQLHLHQQC